MTTEMFAARETMSADERRKEAANLIDSILTEYEGRRFKSNKAKAIESDLVRALVLLDDECFAIAQN